jgi:hypothetical protein
MQGYMLDRWLTCMLHYSIALSTEGLANTALIPPVLEAMVLILDLAAGIVLQLHRDLPRTGHLLNALKSPVSIVREKLIPAAFEHLVKTAGSWESGKEVLEELLLGQGMLLRWLGGADVLLLDSSSSLVALACSLPLKQPVAKGAVALPVDREVARQVRMALMSLRLFLWQSGVAAHLLLVIVCNHLHQS